MSCLFQSLGQLVGEDPTKLRQDICDFIARNENLMEGIDAAKIVEWESQQSLDDYVRGMRATSTWGGAKPQGMYDVAVTGPQTGDQYPRAPNARLSSEAGKHPLGEASHIPRMDRPTSLDDPIES